MQFDDSSGYPYEPLEEESKEKRPYFITDDGMLLHNWSGWPGAWCLNCGQEDKLELCLADCIGHDIPCNKPECQNSHPCPGPLNGRNPYSLKLAPEQELWVKNHFPALLHLTTTE